MGKPQPHPLATFSIEEHELAIQDAFFLTAPDIFLYGGAKRYALIQEALSTFKQPLLARKIGSALLAAQARNLRSVQLMAARGYPQEAATITRTALERGFLQAFISGDEEKAERWNAHAATEKTFEPFFNCVKSVGKRWYSTDPAMRQAFEDGEKALYAHVSSYAHNNPATTKLLDLRVVDGEVMLSTMPMTTAQAFIGCASIFLAAQRAAELSLHAFVEVFPSSDAERQAWQARIEHLSSERQQQQTRLDAMQNDAQVIKKLHCLLDERRNARLTSIRKKTQQSSAPA